MGNSCSLAAAGSVSDGVFLCCPFSPLDVLDEIWDVTESVSEGFLTYIKRTISKYQIFQSCSVKPV